MQKYLVMGIRSSKVKVTRQITCHNRIKRMDLAVCLCLFNNGAMLYGKTELACRCSSDRLAHRMLINANSI